MKREWSKARKEGIQKKFENWCQANGQDNGPDSFIAFDEASGKVFLDHKVAQEKGYYFHLRMQASQMISSWHTVESFKVSAESVPLPEHFLQKSRDVSVQGTYFLPGKGHKSVSKMDEGDRIQLVNIFKVYAEDKIIRAYVIAKGKGKLPETRELMRQAFKEAEAAAYNRVAGK